MEIRRGTAGLMACLAGLAGLSVVEGQTVPPPPVAAAGMEAPPQAPGPAPLFPPAPGSSAAPSTMPSPGRPRLLGRLRGTQDSAPRVRLLARIRARMRGEQP
jgi:hypothetical protein